MAYTSKSKKQSAAMLFLIPRGKDVVLVSYKSPLVWPWSASSRGWSGIIIRKSKKEGGAE